MNVLLDWKQISFLNFLSNRIRVQGDQISSRNKRPKCSPHQILSKLMHLCILPWEKVAKK
jgi:hypothetical protein